MNACEDRLSQSVYLTPLCNRRLFSPTFAADINTFPLTTHCRSQSVWSRLNPLSLTDCTDSLIDQCIASQKMETLRINIWSKAEYEWSLNYENEAWFKESCATAVGNTKGNPRAPTGGGSCQWTESQEKQERHSSLPPNIILEPRQRLWLPCIYDPCIIKRPFHI